MEGAGGVEGAWGSGRGWGEWKGLWGVEGAGGEWKGLGGSGRGWGTITTALCRSSPPIITVNNNNQR